MTLDPWYKIATPRKEVREGRSFSPDEFAIALEQVVTGNAPADYREPAQFFSRTCFTRALKEHTGMVLRRLAGRTENTAPVMTLLTQFGGGKTHTLASLFHLVNTGAEAARFPGITDLLTEAGVTEVPAARVGVFVGNAWDPEEGRETPWVELARQLGDDAAVAALGASARTKPPGTEAIAKMLATVEAPVLLLFDEVLNFVNRHRDMAEGFHAFIQNLTVAVTGTTQVAAIISLPRSQVEMTDWDQQWQDRITKVIRRVAKDLIANDETEIGEVVRRRLFEDLGDERARKKIAKTYANWCFERSARLPPAWMAVDTVMTKTKAQDFLRGRFEACYPFHPATLAVFQQKWRALNHFQQTRGTLAMLAQWISWAARQHFQEARREPLITLGSAPLHIPEFRSVVLGQLGETRLDAAINADLVGPVSHAKALDADSTGPLRDIHRRVGTAILFESSGGQVDKVAHLPEIRFALGEPNIETTSIDNAALALETSSFFIRSIGTDGFRIHHQATLKKVVNDRRASLNEETEIKPAIRKLVDSEFKRGATIPVVSFPEDGSEIQDSPRLILIIVEPETEWLNDSSIAEQIKQWTGERGKSPRLYPGSLVWCVKKPGNQLRDRIELWLAWQRVAREVAEGILGTDFDRVDRAEVQAKVKDAEEAVKDEIWAGYRFVVLADPGTENGLKVIDLGAGHASANETLCGRIIAALKTEALLNESVGVGYIERHWPPAFNETGAWPLTSLRQSFLNGTLTRLIDPDSILRRKILEFVENGDFGLASGVKDNDQYERLWYGEPIAVEEVEFETSVFLLTKARAEQIREAEKESTPTQSDDTPEPISPPESEQVSKTDSEPHPIQEDKKTTLRLAGTVPPETWNRLGTKVLPKLRGEGDLNVGIDFSVSISSTSAQRIEAELLQILNDLGLDERVHIKQE
ncbi:MAG: DUF499 domain-containing protein [Gammaproteobacteria bacterium]|nr:DUF499 domain-containing protein [Gammaproteobacteria bacterium]MDE0511995.1 DUF499 domain-containing protein [Gammaproteobacteria bacterium]